METIEERLMREEGKRLKMYNDSLGIPTIGYGHNLRDKPISERAAQVILEDDIYDAAKDVRAAFPWTNKLDKARFEVLIDMSFNMGIERLKTFKNTLRLIEQGAYEEAAKNMLESKWATQVGKRATDLAEIMKNGGN